MPDISKINALAIGSVSKVDGLAKASILDIDGVAVPVAIATPTAAYSVRLLGSGVGISSYTGAAMRVRRDTAGGTGDDDEADIAFDSGVISLDSAISNASAGVTATTLGQFLNVGTVNGTTYTNPDSLTVTASCFVDTWYDQAGSNDAEQATHASQPQIHDGTVNTDLITENGKPALRWDGTDDQLLYTTTSATTTCFIVQKTSGTVDLLLSSTTVNNRWHFFMQDGNTSTDTSQWRTATGDFGYKNGTLTVTEGTTTRDQVHTAFADGNQNLSSWIGLDNAAADDYVIGSWYNGSLPYEGDVQEIIIYNSDQSTNRTGIETDINGYFSIY